MRIHVTNKSNLPAEVVTRALEAVQAQVREDAAPFWYVWVELTTEGSVADADATLELERERDDDDGDLLGEHWADDIFPRARVHVGEATKLGEWTVTLSHEVLEMVANPWVRRWAPGPRRFPGCAWDLRFYLVAGEICDPVSASTYEKDGVLVSDFVLPSWFTEEGDDANTFMEWSIGAEHRAEPLQPRAGGFLLFMDGADGRHYILPGEEAPPWAATHLAWRRLVTDPATLARLRERASADMMLRARPRSSRPPALTASPSGAGAGARPRPRAGSSTAAGARRRSAGRG